MQKGNEKEKQRLHILGIDPGTASLGVCLLTPYQVPQVKVLREFDLADYAPIEKDYSCYSKGSVTSSTIGACVANLILRETETFGHIMQWENGDVDDTHFNVVIEKQMNISTNNCCVLSAIQAHYIAQEVPCCILSPSVLDAHYPGIFAGTKGNRSKRKTAINQFGRKLLTVRETNQAPFGVPKANRVKSSLQKNTNTIRKRKKTRTLVSLHALDAMFYAFAYCTIHSGINLDIVRERIDSNSQLRYELQQRIAKYAADCAKKLEEEQAGGTVLQKKRKTSFVARNRNRNRKRKYPSKK